MKHSRLRSQHLNFDSISGAMRYIPLSHRRVYAPPVRLTHPYLIEAQVRRESYIDAVAPVRVKREHCGGLQPSNIFPPKARREATTIVIEPKPPGYYRLFCAHDRALWMPCASATCRRDKQEAERNWLLLVSGQLR